MKRIFWIIIIAFLAEVVYVGVHAASTYRSFVVEGSVLNRFCLWNCDGKVTTVNDEANPIPTSDPNHLNVLVLGIRGEEDIANGGLLTDTIMLISVDKTTKKAVMVSLPRDLYIDMTGKLNDGTEIKLKGKLNEVYVRGLEHSQGLALSGQIISRITGVPVDRAVVFDFNAFAKIVDIMGGIDVYLDSPFSEPKQWAGDNGYVFSLPQGWSHLNSEQALYYARSRYSSSDFDRARRQQQVMLAIKQKASTLGFLSNPKKITNVLDSLKGNVRTNFQPWEFGDILTIASSFKDSSSIHHTVLTPENLLYESKGPHNEYILLPRGDNYSGIRNFFQHMFENPIPPTPTPSPKPSASPSVSPAK